MSKKLTIELDVSEASEVSEGVFVTHLSHPNLDGVLSFTHSLKTETSVLGAIKKPKDDPITELIKLIPEVVNELGFG